MVRYLKTRAVLLSAAAVAAPIALRAAHGQTPATSASTPAAAQATQPAESAAPAAASPVPIIVKAVKGRVTWRPTTDSALQPAKVGDVLREGAEVFTSVASAIEIQVGAGQVFTFDRLGKFILRTASVSGGTEASTVQVPYGRVQFNVSSATVANDVKIQAPDATLAVKGTIGGMEVAPGFPTLAFGGELNRGVFDVEFGRITTTFRGREAATAKTTSTARYAERGRYVNTNDIWSLHGDEDFSYEDFQTILFALLEIYLRDLVPEAPFDVFFIDETTGDLYLSNVFGTGGRLGATTGANTNVGRGTGAALVFGDSAAGTYLRLESTQGNARLLSLDLGSSSREFQEIASGSGFAGLLTGLGALGNDLFAVQDLGSLTSDQIVQLTLDGKGDLDIEPVMNLGIQLDDSLAGITPAGVLLVGGRLPTGLGSNGAAGILGANGVLLEVDPRINYLSGATSDLDGSLAVLPTTDIEAGLVIDSVQRITGISLVIDVTGTPLLLVTTSATVGGIPNVPIVNIFTLDDQGNPQLAVVRRSTFRFEGLASESRGAVGESTVLAPAPSPSQIDQNVDALFADLAYSQSAVDSGVMERLIANQIVQTADDPAACASSVELMANLAAAIAAHIDQRAGAGAAIFDFRSGLSSGHPCEAPGAGGSGSTLATSFAFIDEYTGDLFTRDLAGNQTLFRPGDGQSRPILGAALGPTGGGTGRAFLSLMLERTPDGLETPTLWSLDLQSPGASPQRIGAFPQRFDDATNEFVSYELAGLATIGPRTFTSGFERRSPGPEGGSAELATIFEVTGPTSLALRMAPQLDMQAGALAGAPARGTIFALGQIPGTAGASGTFQLAGSGANAVLLEMDPRSNFLVDAHSADLGAFTIESGTAVTGGIDPASITRVVGMSFLGNTLVMNAVTTSGQNVIVHYNPGATNLPTDPRVRRLDGLPAFAQRPRELASEALVSPPAPIGPLPPSGPIDTISINRTFAQMGYSASAAASGVVRALVAEHIAATASNPALCRASSELNGPSLQSILGQHVNQQAGIGQTVFQFRQNLPVDHPCRPPGAP